MRKLKLTLSKAAIEDGRKSGLTKKDMQALGMYSLTVSEMLSHFGIAEEGYAIPYDDIFYRVKILWAAGHTNKEHKQKYTQPKGTKPQIYFPQILKTDWNKVLKDPSIELVITEGEKKAAAACKCSIPCIGMGGVWCFKSKEMELLEDFDKIELDGRKVLIAYDSDIVDKRDVRVAESELARALEARGATVLRLCLPQGEDGAKTGLDDFLVEQGLSVGNISSAQAAFFNLGRAEIAPAQYPHMTDTGNAIRFSELYKNRLRYVPSWKSWLVNKQKTHLWAKDIDGEAMRCAKNLPASIRKEAQKAQEEKLSAKLQKWAQQSENEPRIKAMLNLATSDTALVLNSEQLDADDLLLAFKNGQCIELKTGKVRNISPSDYLSKSVSANFDPKAKCPRWDKFLHQVFSGDKEIISYVQRIIGYSLSGKMTEQCFFILHGHGANGKSTFLNVLLEMFGDYGRQASPQTFMAQKNESATRSDLVRLQDVRFIATSETEQNQRLAESLVKQWTSGDRISTRNLYSTTFEFEPKGKLFIATNHQPRIFGTDDAIWRRIVLLPFTRTFTDKDKDPNLLEKLKGELSGILNWAIEGYNLWQQQGLNIPASIKSAVGQYRNDMDLVATWLNENCVVQDGEMALVSSLYEDYKAWCDTGEEYMVSKNRFVRMMQERGFKKHQTTKRGSLETQKGWFLLGLSLNKRETKFSK